MNVAINITIPRELPVKQLNNFVDKTVFNVARLTLDYTNSKKRFPYLTGELNRAAMAEGVVTAKDKSYYIGATGVSYAPTVWKYPQNINWTNPNTYAQWYITEFKNEKEKIVQTAINNAMRLVK